MVKKCLLKHTARRNIDPDMRAFLANEGQSTALKKNNNILFFKVHLSSSLYSSGLGGKMV